MTTLLLLLAVATLGACAAPVSQDVAANDNRTPAGMLRDGVLTLNLSVRIGQWQPEGPSGPSLSVPVFAEADRAPEAPGPLIRVPTGTRLAVLVRNELKIAVDVHGLHDRPGHSSDVVTLEPGSSRKLEFSAGPPGTYYYWATIAGLALDERNGYDGQLTGAFIVDAPGADPGRADDRVFVIGHWSEEGDPKPQAELMDGEAWVLNGRSWPATERLSYPVNRPIRWRIINASYEGHPMHLHGNYFQVNASGDESSTTAFAETDRPLVATNVIPSGQTIAIAWTPQRPGNWLFHCHILFHVDPLLRLSPPEGAADHQAHASGGVNHMAGLVLGIVVQPDPAAPAAVTASHPRALTLQVGEREGVRFAASPDTNGEEWPGLGYRLVSAGREDAAAPFTAPGPPLILTRGEPVAIAVENHLSAATTVHWHGIELESYYDGVAGWGGQGPQITPVIKPGETFVARFTPPRAGTFIYHTHLSDYQQLSTGLYGALIVVEPGERFDPAVDKVFVLSRDGPDDEKGSVLVNGSATPVNEDWRRGVSYRLRFIGITPAPGVTVSLRNGDTTLQWRPIAKDGAAFVAQRAETLASQEVSPGETYDFAFTPASTGDLRLRAVLSKEIEATMMIGVN